MIKVSVYYPKTEDVEFDVDYYCNRHVPMVMEELGDACIKVSVETGICGANANEPMLYVAVGHLYFESLEIFQKAFEPCAETIIKDIANCTNATPIIQISEVII